MLFKDLKIYEDIILYFYDNQTMKYRKFSKKDCQIISDCTYDETLISYKKFISYLHRNYEWINEDLDFIRDIIVNDYIYAAQLSLEKAGYILKNHFKYIFDEGFGELSKLEELVKNVYKGGPKWHKRGNI